MDYNEIFTYDPTIPSCLRWKTKTANRVSIGDIAGSIKADKNCIYYQVMYKGKSIGVHRVIWQMFNGPIDKGMTVDHINVAKVDEVADNRIENLRICTAGENIRNKKMKTTNTSGFKGVYPHKSKWRAQICINYKVKYLGTFTTKEEAALSYDKAALEYHGEFALTNKMLGLI